MSDNFDYTVLMRSWVNSWLRSWRWLLIPLLVIISSCQEKSGLLNGSSADKFAGGNPPLAEADAGLVSISELSENPALYVGKYLRVSGELSRIPESQCSTKSRSAPGRMRVSEGDFEIPVASSIQGLDQMSSQHPQMELAGTWLEWEGLVGCGSEARPDRQYYLSLHRIISPNPLALVEVLPTSAVESAGGAPETSQTGTGESPEMALPTLVSPIVTESISASDVPFPERALGTPRTTATGDQPDESLETPTETAAGDDETPGGLPTLTDTPVPTEPETTPTPTIPAADTGTAAPSQPVFQLDLPVSTIANGQLAANEVHRWTHEITTTKHLTINVASDPFLDVEISVVAPDGRLIAQQNEASGKEPEILREVTLLEPGVYDILISSPLGEPGYYAIMFNDQDSYSYVFQGTLESGDIGSGAMAFESDHFWHFLGTAGQSVSIVATPSDDSDLFFNLFDTNGDSLIRYHDETASGEPEQIINYLLPDTGLYSLRIGEYNFQAASYEIYLTD